ncbi:hypothetical protein [uncultured Rikenella sp.]|uniref:hypothetical protein n=1 Tax=uncultured Rikenella sp. TaxID=368003 RepID=UPI0025E3B04B|nr:hypothetical protein [uncultured Rikenella sp.]
MFITTLSAPGFRDAGNNGLFGILSLVGSHVASWSSSISDVYSIYLYSTAQIVNPINAHARDHSFQLRCLSE